MALLCPARWDTQVGNGLLRFGFSIAGLFFYS